MKTWLHKKPIFAKSSIIDISLGIKYDSDRESCILYKVFQKARMSNFSLINEIL